MTEIRDYLLGKRMWIKKSKDPEITGHWYQGINKTELPPFVPDPETMKELNELVKEGLVEETKTAYRPVKKALRPEKKEEAIPMPEIAKPEPTKEQPEEVPEKNADTFDNVFIEFQRPSGGRNICESIGMEKEEIINHTNSIENIKKAAWRKSSGNRAIVIQAIYRYITSSPQALVAYILWSENK